MSPLQENENRNDTRIRKVGIYIDTKNSRATIILVIRQNRGTFYFPIRKDDFLNGWAIDRRYGYPMYYQQRYAQELPPEVIQALAQFSVTPSFVTNLSSQIGPKRIKWAHRRKGGWGGRRPHAGRRRSARHEGQYDN